MGDFFAAGCLRGRAQRCISSAASRVKRKRDETSSKLDDARFVVGGEQRTFRGHRWSNLAARSIMWPRDRRPMLRCDDFLARCVLVHYGLLVRPIRADLGATAPNGNTGPGGAQNPNANPFSGPGQNPNANPFGGPASPNQNQAPGALLGGNQNSGADDLRLQAARQQTITASATVAQAAAAETGNAFTGRSLSQPLRAITPESISQILGVSTQALVRTVADHLIWVVDEVRDPGPYAAGEGTTLAEMLQTAGGVLRGAAVRPGLKSGALRCGDGSVAMDPRSVRRPQRQASLARPRVRT